MIKKNFKNLAFGITNKYLDEKVYKVQPTTESEVKEQNP